MDAMKTNLQTTQNVQISDFTSILETYVPHLLAYISGSPGNQNLLDLRYPQKYQNCFHVFNLAEMAHRLIEWS